MTTLVRFFKSEQGSGAALAITLMALFILIAAGLTDYYGSQQKRSWAYGLISEAARAGSEKVDLGVYLQSGQIQLSSAAYTAAQQHIQSASLPGGVTVSNLDIRTLLTGGTISNYPPVSRANWLSGSTNWTETSPAVGVYTEMMVPTHFLGLVNGGQPIILHSFAGATVGIR